jgi:FAD binding domain/Berberine and berberine like
VRDAALTDLRRSLSGFVAEPSDPAYQTAVTIDNGRIALRPAFVVFADSTADIAATLRFAQAKGLDLTVRGGGHSAAGYCLNDGGIVLDLALLDAVSLDAESQTLRVQMGATWEQIYERLLAETDLIPIGGGCLPVGIPGFVLGGGFSFVSRSYGLSVDNLLSLTIVTPDLETRTISAESTSEDERDLFWACRGGGGGNFGVVVEMELRLHKPNTPKMLLGVLRWPVEQAHEVLGFYNDWIETVPPELAVYGFWGTQADPVVSTVTDSVFGFTIVYNGDFADGAGLIEPLLRLDPMYANLSNQPLPAIEELIGGSTVVGDKSAYMWSGILPPRGLTAEVVGAFREHMATSPSADSFAVWTHLGGKVEEVPPDGTAFPHRSARFVPELKTIWIDPSDTRTNVEWAHRFFLELEPHFTGAYVNYIDPLLRDWPRMYYGGNYERLLGIKARWDPHRFFDFQQSIGSPFEPSMDEPLDLSPLNRTFLPSGGET